jgi:hypothetical protein
LFEELKRRKFFRVAAVYAVVSWVAIQIADTLFPALQLPDWTVTLVAVMLILGFFPTLVVIRKLCFTGSGTCIPECAAWQVPRFWCKNRVRLAKKYRHAPNLSCLAGGGSLTSSPHILKK